MSLYLEIHPPYLLVIATVRLLSSTSTAMFFQEAAHRYSLLMGDRFHLFHDLTKHHNLICSYQQIRPRKFGPLLETLGDSLDFDPYKHSMVDLIQKRGFRLSGNLSIPQIVANIRQQQATQDLLLMLKCRVGDSILNRCQELMGG